ncbi:MAG: hypothetical protein ACXVLQ_04950 [Bacteriovorax sp.]
MNEWKRIEKLDLKVGTMAQFVFEAENLGQFLRVIEGLKTIDSDVLVKEKNEITPFESDIRVKIQIEASYEQVLKNLESIKNSKTPLETIRPLQLN